MVAETAEFLGKQNDGVVRATAPSRSAAEFTPHPSGAILAKRRHSWNLAGDKSETDSLADVPLRG
jgi:hypothetical protein